MCATHVVEQEVAALTQELVQLRNALVHPQTQNPPSRHQARQHTVGLREGRQNLRLWSLEDNQEGLGHPGAVRHASLSGSRDHHRQRLRRLLRRRVESWSATVRDVVRDCALQGAQPRGAPQADTEGRVLVPGAPVQGGSRSCEQHDQAGPVPQR